MISYLLLFSSVYTGFGGVAMVLAMMGLFGLTSYTIVQRVKEVGVRKVLGASSVQIFRLLASDILLLVVVANVIALPLGHVLMKQWLQQFASQASIGASVFVLTTFCTILVSALAISFHVCRAARLNPILLLRTE